MAAVGKMISFCFNLKLSIFVVIQALRNGSHTSGKKVLELV
jgi:hypothetical protein